MKSTISQDVANTLDVPITTATGIVDSVLNELKRGLTRDGSVTLRGFGSFHILNKRERMGRNPKTGENAVISARKVPIFKASKLLKAKVNKGSPCA